MTALAFIKSICKSTGLTFAFTCSQGKVVPGEYIQLVFRRPGNQFSNLILWYNIQSAHLGGDCSVHGQFTESDDARKTEECLRPLMNALNGHADRVELILYDKFLARSCTRLFAVSGKSCEEIIVKIDLCMKQSAEIEAIAV